MMKNIIFGTVRFSGFSYSLSYFSDDGLFYCSNWNSPLIGSSQPLVIELAASSLLIRSSKYLFAPSSFCRHSATKYFAAIASQSQTELHRSPKKKFFILRNSIYFFLARKSNAPSAFIS